MALRQAFLILLCVALCHQFVNGATSETSAFTDTSPQPETSPAATMTPVPSTIVSEGTTPKPTPKPMFPPDISIALNGSAMSNDSMPPLNDECLELYEEQLKASAQTLAADINAKLTPTTGDPEMCEKGNGLSIRWRSTTLTKIGETRELSLFILYELPSPPNKTVDQIEACAYEIFNYALYIDHWLPVSQERDCPTINLTFTKFYSPGIEWCRKKTGQTKESTSLLDIQNVPPKLIIPFIANVNITKESLSVACATAYSEEMESHSQVRASDVNVALYNRQLCREHQNSNVTGLGVIWKSAKVDPSSTNTTVVRVVLEMPGVRDIEIRAHEYCGTDIRNFYSNLSWWANGGPNFPAIGPCPKITIDPFQLCDDGMAWCERLEEDP